MSGWRLELENKLERSWWSDATACCASWNYQTPMKTLIAICALALPACDRSPSPLCKGGKANHDWGKWTSTGGKSGAGTDWMKRQCETCGWQQERGVGQP